MITKEQYGEWRNHPATLFFRKFLKDRREHLIHRAMEEWLSYQDVNPPAIAWNSRESRGKIAGLYEVEDVPFEVIETFYKEQEQEQGEDAA